MKLTKVHIKNFRGITDLKLDMGDLLVIIGENNTGKTSILEALSYCLSRSLTGKASPFSEYDYHLADTTAQPSTAEPLEVHLKFEEETVDDWENAITQKLEGAVNVEADGDRQNVWFKVTSYYEKASNGFITTAEFLNNDGDSMLKASGSPRYILSLQQLKPVFYLGAFRDAAHEFSSKSKFWGSFLKDMNIDDATVAALEKGLSGLNKKILKAYNGFDDVKKSLEETKNILPLDSRKAVSIEPLPAKVFDLLSKTQVMLTSKAGARLPIDRHGPGTQSLSILFLFDAFLKSKLKRNYSSEADPILAIEEPEAHLHPSAIKSTAEILKALAGQKIITTHSGQLLSGFPLENIRRLRRVNDKVEVFQLKEGTLTKEEARKMNYHARMHRGDLLLARAWLLVEGETDLIIFSELSRILGLDLYSKGVCCVEYSQVSCKPFIKLAKDFGIDWCLIADGDKAGNQYVNTAKAYCDAATTEAEHIMQLSCANMEVLLCKNGFGHLYEKNIEPQNRTGITAKKSKDPDEYWLQVVKNVKQGFSKGRGAMVVIAEIEQDKTLVPREIKKIIKHVLSLAERCA